MKITPPNRAQFNFSGLDGYLSLKPREELESVTKDFEQSQLDILSHREQVENHENENV